MCKKNKISLILLLTCLFFVSMCFFSIMMRTAPVEALENYVTNGNFAEKNTSADGFGWSTTGISLSADNFVSAAKSGAKNGNSLKIDKTLNDDIVVSQSLDNMFKAGKKYVFSFRYRTSLIENSNIGSVYLSDSDNNVIEETNTKLLATNQIWQTVIKEYTSTKDECVTLKIELDGCAVQCYFSDFTLTDDEALIKNADLSVNNGTSETVATNASYWSIRWGGTDYVSKNQENPHGSQNIVESKDYADGTDNGKAILIKRYGNVQSGALVDIYPTINTLLQGYSYRVSWKVYSDALDGKGESSLVFQKSGSSAEIVCRAAGGNSCWKEQSFEFTLAYGESLTRLDFRFDGQKSDKDVTVLFAEMKIEMLPESESFDFANGNFSKTVNGYPDQWGISGTANVADNELTLSSNGSEEKIVAAFFSSIYEFAEHELKFSVKFNGLEAKNGFKVRVTTFKDEKRTILGDPQVVDAGMLSDSDDYNEYNAYVVGYTAPKDAKYVDVSFIVETDKQVRFSLKDVSLGLSEGNYNLDFEVRSNSSVATEKPLYWTLSEGMLVSEKGSRPDGEGKYIAKITDITSKSSFKSTKIPITSCEINQHYELSYWIKADVDYSTGVSPQVFLYDQNGEDSKIIVYGGSADVASGLKAYTKYSNIVNYTYHYSTYGNTVTSENEDGWVYQRLSFKTAQDTASCVINFSISGAANCILLDDIKLIKKNSTANLDFEYADENDSPESWYLSQARDENPQLKVVDNVYHSGSHSLYVNTNSKTREQYITSAALIPVNLESGVNVYEASFWISSRNSDLKSIQLDVWFHGEDGVKIYSASIGIDSASYVGTRKSLNSGSERSEWSQVITRVPIETNFNDIDIKYVSLNFSFTPGKAEIWIDDIVFDKVESNDEVIVFYNDVHAEDESGNVAGWMAVDESAEKKSGILSRTEETDHCYVTLPAVANTFLCFEDDKSFGGYRYKLSVVFKSDYHVNLSLKFYDYNHVEIDGTVMTETLASSGGWTTANYEYYAPSSTFTRYLFDNGGEGTLSVREIVLRQTGQSDAGGDWSGYWVSYKTDFRHSDEYSYSYYRAYVDLDENKEIVYAPLQFTGDDRIALYVNGTLVVDGTETETDTWASIKSKDITEYLIQGERNSLAFKVFNAGAYSAMIYDGIWKYDDDTTIAVVSNEKVRSLNENDLSADNLASFREHWMERDFDDSTEPWHGAIVQGAVPMDPWGSVYYDNSLYIDNRMEVKVVEGEDLYVGDLVYKFVLDIKPEKELSNVSMIMTLGVRNSTKTVCNLTPIITENGDMKSWKVGEWNRVCFTVNLPDYLDSGTYTLQLSDSYFVITNADIYDNKFIYFRVGNNYVAEEPESKIESINGVPTFTVNGEPKAAHWYIYSPSASESSLEQVSKTGIETIVNFDVNIGRYEQGSDLWAENDTLDFDSFDSKMNTMVAANPDGNIVVTLGMYAPQWWLAQNKGNKTAYMDANLKIVENAQVSYGSVLWKEKCCEIIERIVSHMREQSYYSKVVGFRMTCGQTAENVIFDATSSLYTPDYSQAALDYFRNWAKETYKTIENLRIVWNDPTIESFETIEFPDYNELRVDGGYNGVYDPVTQQKLIDFRSMPEYMVSDCLNAWAKAIKDATDNKLIVGVYYGYLWNGPAYGIGTQGISEIYGSEYIDYFFAPIGYNARQLGEGVFTQAVADSARAYGKLLISEQDNRTCLSMRYAGTKWNTSRDYSVGVTHTFNDSILQLKRDTAYNICNGNGQWEYDMLGGWFNDDQLQQLTNSIEDELNYTNYIEKDLANDVAVVIPDSNAEYIKWSLSSEGDGVAASNIVRMQWMYSWSKKYLEKTGVGYDLYALSTIVDSVNSVKNCTMPEYKVYLFLNPYVLTREERDAIEKHCKKNGSVCVFLMESGWGYNTDDLDEKLTELAKGDDCAIGYKEEYMKEFTGFDIKVKMLAKSSYSLAQVTVNNDNHIITSGLKGYNFGSMANATSFFKRVLWVENDGSESFTPLGVLTDDNEKIGFALKKMPTSDGNGTWTSIWCAAPCLTTDILRGIYKYAGIHSYTAEDESDLIVWSNSAYVGAHSATSGTKKIYLDGYYSVYDVFEGRYVSMNTNVIEYENTVNDTHLFRLGELNKYSVLVRVSGGHGSVLEVTADGTTAIGQTVNYVTGGTSKTYTVTPDEGYVVKSVTVNGEEITLDENNSFTLSDINDSLHVVITFKREAVEQYVEKWVRDEKFFNVPNWLIAIISVAVIGGLVWLIVYKNFIKKGVRK